MIIRFDIYKHNPWRAPGSAPVLDACGLAGGTPWGGDVAEWGGFHPSEHGDDLSGWVLEHKICALAINRSCHFLFLVLVSPQTTRVLRVYNVFRTWVV